METIQFDCEDVICTSNETPVPDKPEPDPNDDV